MKIKTHTHFLSLSTSFIISLLEIRWGNYLISDAEDKEFYLKRYLDTDYKTEKNYTIMGCIKKFKRANGAPNNREIKLMSDFVMNMVLMDGAEKKTTTKAIKLRSGRDNPEFAIITRSFRKDMLLEYIEDFKFEKVIGSETYPASREELKPHFFNRELQLYYLAVL